MNYIGFSKSLSDKQKEQLLSLANQYRSNSLGTPNNKNESQPTKNYIHAIVRPPSGNDYGKEYLRQHVAKHHH